MSLPVGVVTLTERHGPGEFSAAEYEAVVAEIAAMLAPFDAAHGIRRAIEEGRAQMLGTAGTVTTIAGVSLGLRRYNRAVVDGSWLAFDDIRRISERLAGSTYAERAAYPSIGAGRADLVGRRLRRARGDLPHLAGAAAAGRRPRRARRHPAPARRRARFPAGPWPGVTGKGVGPGA